MDTYQGFFKKLSELPDDTSEGIFSVGEEVELKGSKFRVKAIGTHFMRLELLPQEGKLQRLIVV